jgi:hypothetical protein
MQKSAVTIECLAADCGKIQDHYCLAYANPAKKWGIGCPMAKRALTPEEEQKLNPLKASKRSRGK